MDLQHFIKELAELLDCGVSDLNENSVLAEIDNWDSVTVLGVISIADDSFSKSVTPEDIYSKQTIGELFNFLSTK